MLIVDSQVHLGRSTGSAWVSAPDEGLTAAQRRARRYAGHVLPGEEDLLNEMNGAGVDAAVLIPLAAAKADPDDPEEPCAAAARRDPSRFGIMARIDPDRPEQAALLDRWQGRPEVLGVRVAMRADLPGAVGDRAYERAAWLWPALQERGMPVMVNASGTLTHLTAVASAHPDLRIVVDHLGFAGLEGDCVHDDLGPLLGPLHGLSGYRNVAVKASGLPAMVTEAYPFPRLREVIRQVVTAFGAGRVFWGSNLSRLPCSYRRVVSFFRTQLGFLSDAEQTDILGRALVRWLGWQTLEERGL